MVKSVVTGLCSNHYFTQSDEVRDTSMKHLESLRKKFENDDRLFKEYSKFMEELVEKRYARKCDGKGPDGKT